jgi:glycosyltransferase involved in cell wall biosynthesis
MQINFPVESLAEPQIRQYENGYMSVASKPPKPTPSAKITKLNRKLLIIGSFPMPITGQSVATQLLYEELKKRGFGVDKIELSHHLNVEGIRQKGIKILDTLRILLLFCLKIPFGKKIVYLSPAASRMGFMRDLPAIFLAKLFGQKVVTHFHVGDYQSFVHQQPKLLRQLIHWTLSKTDRHIILAKSLKSNFQFSDAIDKKIRIVANGILPIKSSKSKVINKSRVRILYLSNLIESKGYRDVLKATEILVNYCGLDVETIFCGEFMTSADDVEVKNVHQARTAFFDYIRSHGLEANINFKGVVDKASKTKILEESNIFVLPTNYYIEALPISIIESMAYGVPVIATAHRGIPDLVEDGVQGFFVPYAEPRAIAEKIYQLVKQPYIYARMSEAAIHKFQASFTADIHIKNILSVFKEVDD